MNKIISFLLLFFFFTQVVAQDLYDLHSIKEVKLTFTESNWDAILDNNKQDGHDQRLLGTATVNGIRYDSVGVRYKGNSSYYNVRNVVGSKKLPFNIKINYKKKKQSLPGGYTSLKLSNVLRDPSFLREAMSYEILGKYLPSPKANFIKLYVNDVYLGLYNSTESVNKLFLEKNYTNKDGVLFKCDPNYHAGDIKNCPVNEKAANLKYRGKDSLCYQDLYEIKSDDGWYALLNFTKVLNESPDKIETVLDVDQALWMHAFNNIVVNLDSYAGMLCHNYYLYQDSFGLFHPIPWDMNMSFGGFRNVEKGVVLSNEKMQKMSPFLHYKSESRPFISKILGTNLYRKIYIAHMQTILKDFFATGKFENRIRQIQQTIDYYVKNDQLKLYTYEDFKLNANQTAKAGKSNIIGLTELMNERTQYLKEHPIFQKVQPKITEVKHTLATDKIRITARVSETENMYLVYRYKDKAPFIRVKMLDDGTMGEGSAGDSIYGFEIEKQGFLQYYIIAEAEKTAALSPERAAHEFYEYKQ